MRLRQVVLAARDLPEVEAHLAATLGLGEPFRDPGVAEFGLVNAVFPVGDTFLEVVSPEAENAPARRFLDRAGSEIAGYMVILQTEDLDRHRRLAEESGIRAVWQIDLPDIRTTHFHPRDLGGAILSIDEPDPAPSWRWGGPDWEARSRTDVLTRATGVVLESPDPMTLAARWSALLGIEAKDGVIPLEGGSLEFRAGPRERIASFSFEARDPAEALSTARARGLSADEDGIALGEVALVLDPVRGPRPS